MQIFTFGRKIGKTWGIFRKIIKEIRSKFEGIL